jgi:hypothetical protein
LSKKPFGRLHVHQAFDALGNLVEPLDAEGHGHAPLAAELVDEDLVAGMALDVFKQQRRAAGSVLFLIAVPFARPLSMRTDFGNAVGDLRDFQLRRNLFADALQFAVLFEGFDPVAQIVVGASSGNPSRFHSS